MGDAAGGIHGIDNLPRDKNPKPPMDSELFFSWNRKRIEDLTLEDCAHAECLNTAGARFGMAFEKK